jgi:hypothetical protein
MSLLANLNYSPIGYQWLRGFALWKKTEIENYRYSPFNLTLSEAEVSNNLRNNRKVDHVNPTLHDLGDWGSLAELAERYGSSG